MISPLTGIESTASALQAERLRIDVIGQNISNSQLARGLDGKPYQRQHVVFEKVLKQAEGAGLSSHSLQTRIEKDSRPPRLLYQPGHPDADPATGMVALPDIQIHEEMVDLIAATRAYEANLAVVKNARAMAMQTLSIGKR